MLFLGYLFMTVYSLSGYIKGPCAQTVYIYILITLASKIYTVGTTSITPRIGLRRAISMGRCIEQQPIGTFETRSKLSTPRLL